MHYVIGSGPAGVACARALLARGLPVTILDAGLQLEPEREALRAGMAEKPEAAWTAAERALIAPPAATAAVPDKLSYGSDYPYRGTLPGALRGSFAQGGLSNVWGSAMLPYRARDIPDWPITPKDVEPGYAAAMELLPLAAVEDALAEEWPLYATPGGALPLGRQATRLMGRLQANAGVLREAGIRFGAARLAVNAAPCILCGACLNGCPRALIYSARETLSALRAAGAAYIPGMTVQTIEESAEGVRILALDRAGARHKFAGARAYLAAGALHSTEIMLRSLGQTAAALKDSQYFVLPWLQFRAAPDVRREALHTLAQMFLELDDPEISPFGIHLQVYGYNNLLPAMLNARLGKLARFFPAGMLLNRMLVIQGYLHSAHSGRIDVRLENGQLAVKPVPSGEAAGKVAMVLRKLRSLAGKTGAFPLSPLLQLTAPGRGFHAGGSFPMAAIPAPGQTDLLGRVPGRALTHMVDAAVFPSIPASTITLTAMANAWRIGNAAAALEAGG